MSFLKQHYKHFKDYRSFASKIVLTVLMLLITLSGLAQNGINYKAVIKDGSGNILASSPVNIQFTIYEGVALTNNVYLENHIVNTDANGIVIVNIGEGTTGDDFSTIDWEADEHFLNVQINTGSGLVDLGTTQFKTVPYALVAKEVENSIWEQNNSLISYTAGNVGIGISFPIHTLSVLQSSGTANTVRMESLDHPTGKDLLELVVPVDSPFDSQFIEMQNGVDIVAAINSDGSARFKSVQFEDNSIQTTAAISPIAYGFVQSSGTVASGSGNFNANWNATSNRYEITIAGESYFWTNYTTNATSTSSSVYRIRVNSSGGKLVVYLYDSAGALIQGHFQFVTYK
ncbi:hypothetical protein [Lacinutrix salivirga]